ncbi:MAG: FkbM family methyltransferase [Phycisphaerae bacterium]|nr:FkbM family methyltransferase [Phycisphaerae bacterium]
MAEGVAGPGTMSTERAAKVGGGDSLPRAAARALMRAFMRVGGFTTGYGKLSSTRIAKWSCGGLPSEVLARLRNGVSIAVNPRDYNGRMLLILGSVDPKIYRTCAGLLREGDLFLDIGANYGAVGLLCQSIVGARGRVVMVEPQPVLCRRIRDAIARHALGHCELLECGLLDKEGTLQMVADPDHSGAASLVELTRRGARVEVPVRDARRLLPEVIGGRPFGAKVDVEGAERVVVPTLFEAPSARFVLYEAKDRGSQVTLWNQAKAGGLSVFGIRKRLWSVSYQPIAEESQLRAHADFVAVRLAGPPPVGPLGLAALRRMVDARG